jgi:hypothetical protein
MGVLEMGEPYFLNDGGIRRAVKIKNADLGCVGERLEVGNIGAKRLRQTGSIALSRRSIPKTFPGAGLGALQ